MAGCKTQNQSAQQTAGTGFKPDFSAGPPALVYKTRADYSRLVPVLLSDDRSQIVSYPHPQDIKADGSGYQFPVSLRDGYLLDNRGIGPNVAFLKMTYEEYAKLQEAPSLETLNSLIVDREPLVEMCNCGNRQALKDAETQINAVIGEGKLREVCKVVK